MKRSTRSSTKDLTFVDTSGFYALVFEADDRHQRASEILQLSAQIGARFVTSDYVLDETATLLKARGHGRLAATFLERIISSQALRIEWMDVERFETTRRSFLKHADKAWSFTDCFSFCLMKELAIKVALTKDKHFRQSGFTALLL